jgi:hypothetical protein
MRQNAPNALGARNLKRAQVPPRSEKSCGIHRHAGKLSLFKVVPTFDHKVARPNCMTFESPGRRRDKGAEGEKERNSSIAEKARVS